MNIINTNNLEKVRQLLKKEPSPIIIQAQNDEYNRKLLEHGNFQILLSPESGSRKSTIRNIDSGLNNILAKIASKNNIAIGINLNEISQFDKKQKAERLEKIIQNIKLCRKARAKMAIITNNKREAEHLLLSLGASTQQVSQALYVEK